MTNVAFHETVLPRAQAELLRRAGPAARAAGFYLAGGTAVAIRLGHRRSVDFDWFTDASIPDPLALARTLASAGLNLQVLDTPPHTLHAEADSVRVSFLSYPYPKLRPLVHWPAFGCDLASLEDLACMKLAAISQRGARRDFVDIDALLSAGLDLGALLAAYREKYSVRDVGHLLAALAFFDDADKEAEPILLRDANWDELKKRLRARVRAAGR